MKNSSPPVVVTAAKKPAFFALSALFLSPGNVRKTVPKFIEELAATILAQGLLNALQVTVEQDPDGRLTGRGAVEAGGRRLRALQWLAANKKIPFDFPVECRVIEADSAITVSLIENISQETMHPADEFAAFQTLADEGGTLESIASSFGVTVVHVQRRLKLANVAPELLALYRQNEMTLDQVMALASIDDQKRQLLVWGSLPSYNRAASVIKRKLVEDEVAASDDRAKLVGLDVYLAAGGTVRADLFSDAGEQYLTDPGLLEMLMGECVEEQAGAVRAEGWAWVEIIVDYGYQERQLFRAQPAKYFPETPEIEASRLAFEAELEELDAKNEAAQDAEDWDASEEIESQRSAVELQIDALETSRLDNTGVDKSTSGAVVALVGSAFVVHRGLIRRSEEKLRVSGEGVSAKPVRAEVPVRLMLDLSSHRTAAIQASMITNPHVALAALAHRMAVAAFGRYGWSSSIKISLIQSRSQLEKNSLSLPKCRAAIALDAEHAAWVQRLPVDPAEWFAWLLEQPQSVVVSLIVFATATTVDALQQRMGGADEAGPIAQALRLDMADWWDASPAAYLELVPKSKLIEAVSEASSPQVAREMEKMKKSGAVAFAATHIAGTRWLPPALRSPLIALAEAA